MSMIVIGLVVAGCAGVSGLLAARALRKRRQRDAAGTDEAGAAEDQQPSKPDPFAELPARVGDVVQFGQATRWPTAAILVGSDEGLIAAVLLSDDGGKEEATVVFPPPKREMLWLIRNDLGLPPSPPTRLEIDGMLLDRDLIMPVSLETVGDAPAVGKDGTFAIYVGSIGDAAIILAADITRVWYGQRLASSDFDNLGQVDPDAEA